MKRAAVVLVLALLLPGCGLWEKLTGGKEAKAKAQAQEFWKKPAPPPVAPIPAEKLAALIPKLSGWEGKALGKVTDSSGRQITSARATYERQVEGKSQTVTIEVVDGTFSAEIYGPLARLAHAPPGAPATHKKALTIDGHSGVEEWKTEKGKEGVSIALNVAHRFLFTLDGTGVTTEVVGEWLQAFDLKQLASLAGPSVPKAAAPSAGH